MNVKCDMCGGVGTKRGFQCPKCLGAGVVPIFSWLGWLVILFFMLIWGNHQLLHEPVPAMVTPDIAYGSFATGAFLITGWSMRKAWINKSAGGISVWFPLYFMFWGAANVFVFPLATSPISFTANALAILVNLLYAIVVLRNERLERSAV